jgi:hypothetical protein
MAAFDTELDGRDIFLGDHRCVICGIADPESLQHCYIVNRSDITAVRRMCSQTHVQDRLSSF